MPRASAIRITKPANCGNSPKGQLLQKFAVTLAAADATRIPKLVTEDICWSPAGGKPLVGAAVLGQELSRRGPATALSIEHVITHGRSGAIDGVVEYGRKRRAFCLVADFASAAGQRIASVTVFSTPLD